LDVVRALIEAKANLEHRSQQDVTPLLTAIMRGKTQLVELLLNKGAKLDLTTENLLALKHISEAEMKPEIKKVIDRYVKW
jgi:ankyrin repeat protein